MATMSRSTSRLGEERIPLSFKVVSEPEMGTTRPAGTSGEDFKANRMVRRPRTCCCSPPSVPYALAFVQRIPQHRCNACHKACLRRAKHHDTVKCYGVGVRQRPPLRTTNPLGLQRAPKIVGLGKEKKGGELFDEIGLILCFSNMIL